MEQVFTVPPTLARWNDISPFRTAHYLLFALPLVVQIAVFWVDKGSASLASLFSDSGTWESLTLQGVFFGIVAILRMWCLTHLRADDKEWIATFFYINPGHRHKGKSPWRHWVRLFENDPPGWGILVQRGSDQKSRLFFADTVRQNIWVVEPADEKKGAKAFPGLSALSHGLLIGDDGRVHPYPILARQEGRNIGPEERLTWPEAGTPETEAFGLNPDPLYYLRTSKGHKYHFSLSSIHRINGDGEPGWRIGRGTYQADGKPEDVGFRGIRAKCVHDDTCSSPTVPGSGELIPMGM